MQIQKLLNNLLFDSAMVACILLSVSCSSPSALIRGHLAEIGQQNDVVIVVYGDELSGGDANVGLGNSYADILKPGLAELLGKRISVINTSRENESYQFAARRIQPDILSYRPDFVFVMLGRVDTFTPFLPLETHRLNVEKFIAELKRERKFVVMITTPGLRSFPSAEPEDIQQYDDFVQVTRDIARVYQFPCIDIAAQMKRIMRNDEEEYRSLFSDNSNLSDKGKQFIADYILSRFRAALEEQ
jgi:hypothetical protein